MWLENTCFNLIFICSVLLNKSVCALMDGCIAFYDLFISISVISGSWDGDSARLDRVCITFETILASSGLVMV